MSKKQVRFNENNLRRLGQKGTSEDDADDAFRKLLELDDDVNGCIEGDEPKTEKMQKLKRKWCK